MDTFNLENAARGAEGGTGSSFGASASEGALEAGSSGEWLATNQYSTALADEFEEDEVDTFSSDSFGFFACDLGFLAGFSACRFAAAAAFSLGGVACFGWEDGASAGSDLRGSGGVVANQ